MMSAEDERRLDFECREQPLQTVAHSLGRWRQFAPGRLTLAGAIMGHDRGEAGDGRQNRIPRFERCGAAAFKHDRCLAGPSFAEAGCANAK